MKRGLLIVGLVLVVMGMVAVPASAKHGVSARIHFEGAFDFGRHGGGVEMIGSIKSRKKVCAQRSRRVKLFDRKTHKRIGRVRTRDGSWVIGTPRLEAGDRVYVKVSRKVVRVHGKRVRCAAVKSKTYRVKHIRLGGQG